MFSWFLYRLNNVLRVLFSFYLDLTPMTRKLDAYDPYGMQMSYNRQSKITSSLVVQILNEQYLDNKCQPSYVDFFF
jgi:hypothetical protein